jgi:hypothetical protein
MAELTFAHSAVGAVSYDFLNNIEGDAHGRVQGSEGLPDVRM